MGRNFCHQTLTSPKTSSSTVNERSKHSGSFSRIHFIELWYSGSCEKKQEMASGMTHWLKRHRPSVNRNEGLKFIVKHKCSPQMTSDCSPSKHEALIHCCFNVGPTSKTAGQHSCVCANIKTTVDQCLVFAKQRCFNYLASFKNSY